jgi:hypothetical protein
MVAAALAHPVRASTSMPLPQPPPATVSTFDFADDELHCLLCMRLIVQCVTFDVCGHSFCAACVVHWTTESPGVRLHCCTSENEVDEARFAMHYNPSIDARVAQWIQDSIADMPTRPLLATEAPPLALPAAALARFDPLRPVGSAISSDLCRAPACSSNKRVMACKPRVT